MAIKARVAITRYEDVEVETSCFNEASQEIRRGIPGLLAENEHLQQIVSLELVIDE